MNYIFILLGNDSFYEAIIMSKLAEEMSADAGIFCITGLLQTSYFSDNEKIFKLIMESDMAENKKLFEELMSDFKIAGIFIFDYHKAFFKGVRPIIQFDLKWLENFTIPINLVDYLDIFNYNEMDQLYLTHSKRYNKKTFSGEGVDKADELADEDDFQGENINFLDDSDETPGEDITIKTPFWPNIIKVSPPYPTPPENQSDKIFYWKSHPKNYLTDDLERMKAPLNMIEGRKNVLLMFSYQMMFQSIAEAKHAHYRRIVNIIILYLKKLDIEINLFVIGFTAPAELTKNSKIKLKSFKKLNHGLYKTLTTFADLIIADTPWHPVLLDAADLKIPAGVIGNSLKLLEDGTMESDFDSTDMDIFQELENAIQESGNIFFPYIAFPLKNETPPEFTFYDKKFIYYLLDIYCDSVVVPFLGEFLITDDDVTKNLNEVQEVYSERAHNALTTGELLTRLES